jgi:hypothetical protein
VPNSPFDSSKDLYIVVNQNSPRSANSKYGTAQNRKESTDIEEGDIGGSTHVQK